MGDRRHVRLALAAPLLIAGLAASPQALALNKCVGANGRISYQEQPCATGTKPQVMKGSASSAPGAAPRAAGAGPYGAGPAEVKLVHYEVDGREPESMRSQLRSRGPKGFFGYTGVKLSYKFNSRATGAGCAIESVDTALDITMTMPRWAPPPGASPALVSQWDRFLAALRAHEEGHVERGRRFESALKTSLARLSASSCPELDAAARREYERLAQEHDAEQAQYDRVTNHGRTQGAEF